MLQIDKMSRIPIYEQLIRQFEMGILSGEASSEGQLPSVRTLSQRLNINPNTLQKAFAELERRGLCYTVPGNGRYISSEAVERLADSRRKRISELEEYLQDMKQKGMNRIDAEQAVSAVFECNITDKESEVE